jgi:hypothetical protein
MVRKLTFLVSRADLYLAILFFVAGLIFMGLSWFGVYIDQSDCQGGNSPVPIQGCGYVPYQDLYVTGSTAGFVISYPLLLLGAILLIVRAFLLLQILQLRHFILSKAVPAIACFVIAVTLVSTTYAATFVIYEQQASFNSCPRRDSLAM